MSKFYTKQALISLGGMVVSALFYSATESIVALGFGILFLGAFAQSIWDKHKEEND